MLSACSQDGGDAFAPPVRGTPSATTAEVLEIGTEAWQRAPAAQRAAHIKLVQATSGPELALVDTRPGVLSGWHEPMAFRATFERGRVSLVTASGDDTPSLPVELAAEAWGCEGEMKDVPPTSMLSNADRPGSVSYAHVGFDEWYVFGAAGLEQGFTVRELPACVRRGQKLRIRLRFSATEGALAEVNADGSAALLTTTGRRGVHYGDPFAEDAAGVEHAVRITVGQALALEIDAASTTLPLVVDPLAWSDRQKFTSSDAQLGGFAANDFFGYAVAVSGDTAIVGAYGDRNKGSNAGAAYIFTRVPLTVPGIGSRWAQQQKLFASDAAANDFFGFSVAISGNTALVGAYGRDDVAPDSGAAYVFVRSGSTWTQQQKIAPGDLGPKSEFGFAVALTSDTALIGAPLQGSASLVEVGAAYAYGTSGAAWSQPQKFAPPAGALQANLHFGSALAISGNTMAIGRDNVGAGGVDWFTRSGTFWSSSGAGVSSSVPHFGSALAMTDVATAIGAYGDPSKGTEAGSVSITTTVAPHPLAVITASDAGATDHFGIALAAFGSTLMVGAPNDDDTCFYQSTPKCGTDSGAVYVYTANGTSFTQQQKIKGSYSTVGEHFGASLVLSNSFALVGAPNRGDYAASQGAVWSEQYGLSMASPCTNNEACATGYCVEGVCCESVCNLPCQSCLAALKTPPGMYGNAVTGRCGEVTTNTDPKDGCPATGTICGTTGMCGGKGLCSAAPSGTQCGSGAPICSSPTSYSVASSCLTTTLCAPTPIPCNSGYACKAGACKTSCVGNDDCDSARGFKCLSGACKQPAGTACSADSDCATGTCGFGACCVPIPPFGCATPPGALCVTDDECFGHHCSDGVCCDSACKGPCEACGLLGTEGVCTPVKNDPGDPPGLCSPIGGSAGEAGAGPGPGGGGGGGTVDGAAGVASGGAGAGGTPQAVGGRAIGAGSSAGGEAGSAANAGQIDGALPCMPACAAGEVCSAGNCEDQRVTACGCRVAGSPATPAPKWALLGLLVLGAVRRRPRSRRAA